MRSVLLGTTIAALVATGLAAQQGRYRAGVDLVNVAVMVIDREGNFIPDLKQDDFQLFEEGVKQSVQFFSRGDADAEALNLRLGLLLDTSGSMVVTHLFQILAFMAPVLTVISDLVGVVGGWVIAVFQLRVASSVYWTSVLEGLYKQDPWMGLIKAVFLGFAIVSIGCHVGLRTRGGTQGVGRAVTNAVVAASVAVLAVDFFLTRLLITVMY